ncbi:FHA domain-containing protein [Sessilibacter sp. MAH2]
MLKLKVVGDNKDGIWLVEPKVSVGSSSTNNLVIHDPNVDACHLEIFVRGEDLLIHKRSEQAIFVNGSRIGLKVRAYVNDEITLGSTRLKIIDPKNQAAIKHPATSVSDTNNIAKPSGWSITAQQVGLSKNHYDIRDGFTVGRAKDCDIVILLAHLSRHHAQFRLVGNNRLEVSDLNSSNGTYVNGRPISTTILNPGDELRFDSLTFKVNGPQNDSDKTMVRSAISEEMIQAGAPSVRTENIKPKPAKPVSVSFSNSTARNVERTNSRVSVNRDDDGGVGIKLLLIGSLVLALILVSALLFVF